MAIRFFNDDVNFNLPHKNSIKLWLKQVVNSYGYQVKDINIVFCSDNKILSINKQYLNHDYYTDIITFPYNSSQYLSGDIYISIPTVEHNAKKFDQSFTDELNRVIVHGVLHLAGYNDITDEERKVMSEKEDYWLEILKEK